MTALIGKIRDQVFLAIFVSILDLAASAGNCIVIDRIKGQSSAAELLVEAALLKTAARPTILVVDSLDRLQNFKGEDGKGKVDTRTQVCIDRLEMVVPWHKLGSLPVTLDLRSVYVLAAPLVTDVVRRGSHGALTLR